MRFHETSDISRFERSIRPDDIWLINQIPGVIAVARDENLRMIWCSELFPDLLEDVDSPDDLLGTTLHDILTPMAAKEREQVQREVIKSKKVIHHYQFSADSRALCTLFPLDAEAFGHEGVLVIIKDAPNNTMIRKEQQIPVLSSPNLGELSLLTPRELALVHYVSKGHTTNAIAKSLSRSPSTIDNQIHSIFTKLNMHNRQELVQYATDRGIHSFSDEEWSRIVESSKSIKRERKNLDKARTDQEQG